MPGASLLAFAIGDLLTPFSLIDCLQPAFISPRGVVKPEQQPPLQAVVAIAASAGGLKALSTILGALPADFPAAVVVAQHVSPHQPSLLSEILSRRTPLKVKQAEEGDCLCPSCVFIAPSNHHLLVNPDGTLSLSQSSREHFVRPSAEPLFESVAAAFKERVIAVVLTGGDSDGSRGCQAVKGTGGTVLAQNWESSENFSMPRAAIATGCVDSVLPLADIAPTLESLVRK